MDKDTLSTNETPVFSSSSICEMHSMAGTWSLPMDVVELIAMQVACPTSLSALLGAMPPPAVTPALAALQALTQRPTTVRVTWPRVTFLSTTSASTHAHLTKLVHHDIQIELVLRQPRDILEAAVPLTSVTRVHIAPTKPLAEADGVMLHLALERAPLERIVLNAARQDNRRWLCHVMRLLAKGRVQDLVLVGDSRTSLPPAADVDLQAWLSFGRSLCLRGLHVSAALAAALAQALSLQALTLDRVLGLSGPVTLPASLTTLTWVFDARPLAATAVAASLVSAPRLTHLTLDGSLCPRRCSNSPHGAARAVVAASVWPRALRVADRRATAATAPRPLDPRRPRVWSVCTGARGDSSTLRPLDVAGLAPAQTAIVDPARTRSPSRTRSNASSPPPCLDERGCRRLPSPTPQRAVAFKRPVRVPNVPAHRHGQHRVPSRAG